ncbi:MAG: metallophosphoesterase [Gammaproteobacteria bacterium]|nr:metallophosphoesterase [Gammaproteobacteria bacterium]
MENKYDIIGDIHGCAITLKALLDELGYKPIKGIYSHPNRQVIFLGDFIDRGPHQRKVVEVVRPMIENGTALSVMGNHEFNAIAWSEFDLDRNDYMRPHTPVRQRQHQAFLDAYQDKDEQKQDTIEWFKTLPLWLDLGGVRIIHACWDIEAMDRVKPYLTMDNSLTNDFLIKATTYGSQQFKDVETLLKGKEVALPKGFSFTDKDGHEWPNIRIRWWDQTAKTYQKAFFGRASDLKHVPNIEIASDISIEYPKNMAPVFIGHYWMHGKPTVLTDNIACVDYSVAKPGGNLVAYRWDGEKKLINNKFVSVQRQD